MLPGTWGVDRSHLILYRNNRGCHDAIKMWWWRYRWVWRNASVQLDSLSIKLLHQVMTSTGTCSGPFINFYHFLEINSSSYFNTIKIKVLIFISTYNLEYVWDLYFCLNFKVECLYNLKHLFLDTCECYQVISFSLWMLDENLIVTGN